ncbi:MAG: coproporphyrinogen III oxidase family protein, partial [Nanoarchaeota archaeon]|nr:coproporphyrinogen III oxidase family protein [Nanoarchaeota archaeon]
MSSVRLQDLDLINLSRNNIRKNKFDRDFVYRYPPSVKMPAVDHDALRSGISLRNHGQKAALYVHIPFCTSLCKFCHYYKTTAPTTSAVDQFIKFLNTEISNYQELIGDIDITSIFFGGGTPTFLSSEQLGRILSHLKDIFNVEKHIEKTVESSPETLTPKKLGQLLDIGFNRLSIGVQSFDDKVNENSGRKHDVNVATQIIKEARSIGFKDINIDMIYGLPGQSKSSWKGAMAKALELDIDSIAASELRILPESLYYPHANQNEFVSEKDMLEMHLMFIETFKDNGYTQIFPYQFIKKGRKFDFLETQWSNEQFIGLGPSSCSFYNGWDYNNMFPLDDYYDFLTKYSIPAARGTLLSKHELMIREIALGLKKAGVNRSLPGISK